nr:venom protein U-MPTX.24-Mc41 [Megalopyge crispata]
MKMLSKIVLAILAISNDACIQDSKSISILLFHLS